MAEWGGKHVEDNVYDIILQAACRHNQPTGAAMWLAWQESGFNPRAVSYYEHCCKGLYQFKNERVSSEPADRWGGMGKGYTDEQLFDPALNAEMAMAYMEQNGGIAAIMANVNPWEGGPVALAMWTADGFYNPPCNSTGTAPAPGTNPTPAPAAGGNAGPPGAYPSTPATGPNVGADAGARPVTPGTDWAAMLAKLPDLIKLGFANAVVLALAAIAALIGVYLVVTASSGIDEGDIKSAAIAAAKVAA